MQAKGAAGNSEWSNVAGATAGGTPISPTPTPPVNLVTVTVSWQGTKDHAYTILYGTDTNTAAQIDGGTAAVDGPMQVMIANLQPNTPYYFSDIVTASGAQSAKLTPPVQYTTTTQLHQILKLEEALQP